MKLIRTVLGLVAGTVVILAATIKPATAAPAKELTRLAMCASFIYSGCSFGDHKLQGPSGGGYNGDEAHGDCRTCYQGLPCHTECNISEESESVQAAYKAAVDAAERGDVLTVLALTASAREFVYVNGARGTVQVMACDRSRIIANLSLD